jgi:membrane associated rhomboid family serine protease
MFPLKDDVPTQSFPLVTVGLIVLNVAIYVYEFLLGFPGDASRASSAAAERALHHFLYEFGLVPCRFGDVCPAALQTTLAGAPPAAVTVLTSMFLHGGFLHVAFNMLYLWIFGNNVEDAMGKIRFLIFYLLCGALAAAAQFVSDPRSAVPMIGASGAVSGALGAYVILFPGARVWTLVVFGFFWRLVPIPAMMVLGFWFVGQVLGGLTSFGSREGGVAFLAHVGGFLAGMALVFVFRRRERFAYRRY